jgi:hypothetical protein
MFRFTIRELVLLTVVVAMASGWALQYRQLRSEQARAKAWRQRAGALEHFLKTDGWRVTWEEAGTEVTAFWPLKDFEGRGRREYHAARMSVCIKFHEPSISD